MQSGRGCDGAMGAYSPKRTAHTARCCVPQQHQIGGICVLIDCSCSLLKSYVCKRQEMYAWQGAVRTYQVWCSSCACADQVLVVQVLKHMPGLLGSCCVWCDDLSLYHETLLPELHTQQLQLKAICISASWLGYCCRLQQLQAR